MHMYMYMLVGQVIYIIECGGSLIFASLSFFSFVFAIDVSDFAIRVKTELLIVSVSLDNFVIQMEMLDLITDFDKFIFILISTTWIMKRKWVQIKYHYHHFYINIGNYLLAELIRNGVFLKCPF